MAKLGDPEAAVLIHKRPVHSSVLRLYSLVLNTHNYSGKCLFLQSHLLSADGGSPLKVFLHREVSLSKKNAG